MKFKIVQLNIWRGELLDNAIKFLKDEDPDIITLQEVYDGKNPELPKDYRIFKYFKETFPEYNAVYGAQFCDITKYGNIEEGNAIYSKFPILSSEITFFDVPYGTFNHRVKTSFEDDPQSLLHAELGLNGGKVNVFNIHGIWGLDGNDNARRHKMVDTIIEKIKGSENVILAGDFNMRPDTKATHKLEKTVKSVFGNSLKSTFNMRHKTDPGYATAAVDMIFVSPNIQVLEKKCPDVDVSDHLPLIANLEI